MKGISKFYATLLTLAFGLILTTVWFSCQTTSSQQVTADKVIEKNNVESNQAKEDENAKAQHSNASFVKTKPVDYFAHLKPEHREVSQQWLKSKTFLRPAVEETDSFVYQLESKSDFEGNMKFVRETVGENGYQYYSVGDMNHDGKQDFAILLVDSRKRKEESDFFAMAIFNAPFRKGQKPAYYEENLYGISNSYIVYDLMTEKHLYLGKFESDVYCATYYPKGKTYYFKDCLDE